MTPADNIIVETGNPFCKGATPATYTRFVLPFAYSGKKADLTKNSVWQTYEPEDLGARKSYFTAETAAVLFEKAEYYEVNVVNNGPIPSVRFSDSTISISPPKIALFEASSKSETSLLKTGFLILEIYFRKEQEISFELLLDINELFRYKTGPYEGHENSLAQAFNCMMARYLPRTVDCATEDCAVEEYSHWKRLLKSFFGDTFLENWDVYADSRAFVWTCAVIKDGTKALRNTFYPKASDKWEAHNYGHWIKLLNIDSAPRPHGKYDPGATHKSTEFESVWAKERTYKRWEESGSSYGFNYHCGAAIVPPTALDNKDIILPLFKHFGQMYFDMILILFYVRVTTFRFSNELTKISIEASGSENIEANILDWRKSFESLRWEFTLFTNLYQFPLISNQQQMLEMYSIAREFLDIQKLYEEVKEEINNNQEYILQQVQQSQSESSLNLSEQSILMTANSLRLTRLATVGLVIGMAVTMLETEISKSIGSFVRDHVTPTCLTLKNGLIVDWFLIFVYLPVFWLLLVGLVKVWEKRFGDNK